MYLNHGHEFCFNVIKINKTSGIIVFICTLLCEDLLLSSFSIYFKTGLCSGPYSRELFYWEIWTTELLLQAIIFWVQKKRKTAKNTQNVKYGEIEL